MEAEDQKGVTRDIDEVHTQGHLHGDAGVAHDPEQGRAGAVNGQEGDGRLHDEVVGVGVGRHVRLHLAEHHAQHKALGEVEQYHDEDGRLAHEQQQLGAGVPGLVRLPPAQILPGDDGAAGGQRREGVHQQHVHRVHQGHGGDGRLAHL